MTFWFFLKSIWNFGLSMFQQSPAWMSHSRHVEWTFLNHASIDSALLATFLFGSVSYFLLAYRITHCDVPWIFKSIGS